MATAHRVGAVAEPSYEDKTDALAAALTSRVPDGMKAMRNRQTSSTTNTLEFSHPTPPPFAFVR